MKQRSKTQAKSKRNSKVALSQRTKITLLVLSGCVLVAGGGWWAFYTFTTATPPNLAVASSEDVVEFLGNHRGFTRMPIDRREAYIVDVYQHFHDGQARENFNRDVRRMSRGQRQVFLDGLCDIGRVRVVEHARQYKKLPPKQQAQYVDNAIRNFERMRFDVGGDGVPGENIAEPFKNDVPTGSDEIIKLIVTRTNPRERAEAQSFIDDMAARYKQLKNPQERRRFEAGG